MNHPDTQESISSSTPVRVPGKGPVMTILPILPLPQSLNRPPIQTDRLFIRPLRMDDLTGFHQLRSQREVMITTTQGRPDYNIKESQEALGVILSDNGRRVFTYGAFSLTGEFMGEGTINAKASVHGWPEIGCKFKREFWRQGYATEFLQAMIRAWWELPRAPQMHLVSSLFGGESFGCLAREQLCTLADHDNYRFRNLLGKLGFEEFGRWTGRDKREIQQPSEQVTMIKYRLPAPAPLIPIHIPSGSQCIHNNGNGSIYQFNGSLSFGGGLIIQSGHTIGGGPVVQGLDSVQNVPSFENIHNVPNLSNTQTAPLQNNWAIPNFGNTWNGQDGNQEVVNDQGVVVNDQGVMNDQGAVNELDSFDFSDIDLSIDPALLMFST
ncbi:GNAT domain-containing protein [Hypoxylon fuscum]|nr:GNAT domain-containing protein [Hypoxylon fuscum]